jgi:hypothetical protein
MNTRQDTSNKSFSVSLASRASPHQLMGDALSLVVEHITHLAARKAHIMCRQG